MRTRFPPSPTGFLHVGGLRTALYCYLVAKQSGDDFILRIEDTDRERTVEGAVENILRTLAWAGLNPDEGPMLEGDTVIEKGDKGPYTQSERAEIYKEHAQKLLDSGHAYYAFDTKEELERMREEEQKAGNPAPKYDVGVRKRMRNALTMSEEEVQAALDAGEPYVIRLLVPENQTITAQDHIRGKVEVPSHAVDDTVLMKADGFPTYHLASVVDDHLMEVEIVIRGEEWLPSLPKHILLYQAFGWDLPEFAHVPLLMNPGGGKLSKRQGDVAAEDFIKQGYLPEALLNFLAMLGWNTGDTKELYSMDELIKEFSIDRIQKSGAVLEREKLDWLQGQWMRKMPLNEFAERIKPLVVEQHPAAADDADFLKKAELIQERITFFKEAPEMLSYYYSEPTVDKELMANKKQKVSEEMLPELLQVLTETLEPISEADWTEENLHEILFAKAEEKELKRGQILWPLRAALTGLPFSPGAFEVAAALGKETTMKRLQVAAESI